MERSRVVQPKRVTSYHNSLSLCGIKVPLLCLLLLWCFVYFFSEGHINSTWFSSPTGCVRRDRPCTRFSGHRWRWNTFCSHVHHKVRSPCDCPARSWDSKINSAFQIPICKTKPSHKNHNQREIKDGREQRFTLFFHPSS